MYEPRRRRAAGHPKAGHRALRSRLSASRRLVRLAAVLARVKIGIGQRGLTAHRCRQLSAALRARLDLASGRQLGENSGETLRREVLVIVVVDLRHRRVHAGAQALDLDPGELPVSRDVHLLADTLMAELDELVG